MKTRWRDGTTHVILSDSELLEKLSALVPAPRFHLVRYFGILAFSGETAPLHRPGPASGFYCCPLRTSKHCRRAKSAPAQLHLGSTDGADFAVDVLECPRCGSRMRILAAIEDPSVAGKILDCLGLPSRPPPVAPARRDRQDALPEF